MNWPFEWQLGWRYTRAGRAGRRDGFISFISGVSMFGIALGVAALIIVLSVMNGFQKEVRERILGVASHLQLVGADGRLADWEPIAERAARHPRVLATAPFVEAQGMLTSGGSKVCIDNVPPEDATATRKLRDAGVPVEDVQASGPDMSLRAFLPDVQTAVKNAGLHFPRHRIVVNLAPAAVRKEGPAYDLPIALGVIMLSGHLPPDAVQETLVVGERSLDGVVRHTRGILPMAATARANGYKRMFVPEMDAPEAALIPDLEVYPVRTLADLYNHLSGRQLIEPYRPSSSDVLEPLFIPTDFSEIKGQEHVKRALEVAAAGGHNALMVGSPGAGKTLLARAVPGILPAMSIEESLDVTRLYSVADQLPPGMPLIQHRPFRAPHHTISHAGLVGGGNIPKPGEISLAHRGVLFLDEFPEFGQRVLEVMRQPMEDKVVTISRAKGSLTFPANFQLIAAMNP